MSRSFDASAGFVLVMLSLACATPRAQQPRTDRNVITHEQLREHHFVSAYDAVQSLRSNWLSTRGVDSFRAPSRVLVYFDDVKLGGVETLHTVSINAISYIRHFDGISATERWGLDHGAGVIYVSTHPTVVPPARR